MHATKRNEVKGQSHDSRVAVLHCQIRFLAQNPKTTDRKVRIGYIQPELWVIYGFRAATVLCSCPRRTLSSSCSFLSRSFAKVNWRLLSFIAALDFSFQADQFSDFLVSRNISMPPEALKHIRRCHDYKSLRKSTGHYNAYPGKFDNVQKWYNCIQSRIQSSQAVFFSEETTEAVATPGMR